MAHIPYGYRIENGSAVIVRQEADKIRLFFRLYLAGNSIRAAAAKASLPISQATAVNMVRKTIYLGDGYYPAIIDSKLYRKVINETERREQERKQISAKKREVTVPDRFLFASDGLKTLKKRMDPSETASALYELVTADEKGTSRMEEFQKREISSILNHSKR